MSVLVYSVTALANAILKKSREKNIDITNLKMQKLVYFAQGFSLALLDRPLFPEEIQAWTYGPVIPSLYNELKKFGSEPLKGMIESDDIVAEEDAQVSQLLDEVIDRFGKLSASDLVALSHKDGSPWALAWEKGKYTRIPLWLMMSYFKRIIAK